MAVKGANTIKQYKILKYIDENFYEGSVKTELIASDKVKITDCKGESLTFAINDKGKIVECDPLELLY